MSFSNKMTGNEIISKNELVQKIEFKHVDTDFRTVKATDGKYIILSLFIGQHRFISNIQGTIDILQMVQSGNKTWKEIMDPLMFLQIDYAGDLKCNQTTAFFISDQAEYSNLEMPLQELIDLMKEWKAFMS